MTDLAEFLLTRIAEDEASARAASIVPPRAVPPPDAVTVGPPPAVGRWGWGGGPFRAIDDPVASAVLGLSDSDSPYYVSATDGWDEGEPTGARYDVATVPSDHDAARHIARWDPTRVLAECDAKRRIMAWHRMINGLDTEDRPVRGCGNCIASGAVPPYIIAGPCMTVRLLALPHADHPDYREEWKP